MHHRVTLIIILNLVHASPLYSMFIPKIKSLVRIAHNRSLTQQSHSYLLQQIPTGFNNNTSKPLPIWHDLKSLDTQDLDNMLASTLNTIDDDSALEKIAFLVHAGANPNVSLEEKNEFGCGCGTITNEFALTIALKKNDISLIKLLLDHGANPNVHGADIWTNKPALFFAQTAEAAQLLLNAGADIHAIDEYYWYGILEHIISDDFYNNKGCLATQDLFQMYLDHGANPRAKNFMTGKIPLHTLAERPSTIALLEKTEALINAAPDTVNALDRKKKTPLDYALDTLNRIQTNISIAQDIGLKNGIEINKTKERRIKTFITLLKKHGGKTAQEIVNDSMNRQ